MLILGIETSCDETAVALCDSQCNRVVQQVYTQIDTHAPYGGVVPELASRDHVAKLAPMVEQFIKEQQLDPKQLDGLAYTRGPGLIGALMVGACVGKTLAYGWGIPCLGVHHIEAHLLAVMLEESRPSFPFVALIVSGGHTMLVHAKSLGDYSVIGETLDDAAGEAFDKTAKLIGLPYPGGPSLAKLAEEGNPEAYPFTRPMMHHPSCDMSFSGLKTQVAQTYSSFSGRDSLADLAASFQATVVDVLLKKSERALQELGLKQLVIAGGVSANKRLRCFAEDRFSKQGIRVFVPRLSYCTDNAAMVAYAGSVRMEAGEFDDTLVIEPKARWALESLRPPGATPHTSPGSF